MNRKTAIVTGTSSGFGMHCAIELAKAGFYVISTMRNIGRAESLLKLADENKVSDQIHLYALDVTSTESILTFKDFIKEFPSIDVLVNNAGFALGGFSEELPIDEYRLQFETNVFGVIAITQTVLPFMRKNKRGRIINMSSISGKFGFPGLSPYTASKHALEGYSESLRLELRPFGIDVVLIEPGSYQTNIWSSVDNMTISSKSPYYFYMEALMKNMESSKGNHGDPVDVAQLVTKLATATKTPKLRYPIGRGVRLTIWLKAIVPWKTLERIITMKLVGNKKR
ncbi:NAD(P)-dependent dehydrogenase (short-subunit alcohol dehydrogenase family) [Fictibacillus halophilus]|uniref:NAD(P)-dependent dehydrogenase (Short-subunit alcohol dehydrogenase family) n=1 Tax=Fictibacillus halophilus TaxID=1610490 RepID=A0ABV2LL90_9BACL|nr:SDR family oxidoreductase [Fictibacillus halophilus]